MMTPPRWYDRSIAGYVLQNDEKHNTLAVRDPASGYMIMRGAECDGAILSLLLTKDRKRVAENGYQVPGYKSDHTGDMKLQTSPLRSLATGRGVKIGDSPLHVKSVLGSPTSRKHDGPSNIYWVWTYTWNHSPYGDIEQTYTFKNDKLIEIQFSQVKEGE